MPTLDDLAARLAALGWAERNGYLWQDSRVFAYCPVDERPELDAAGATLLVRAETEFAPSFDGYLYPEVWTALDIIRQWQSGARPEPVGAAQRNAEIVDWIALNYPEVLEDYEADAALAGGSE